MIGKDYRNKLNFGLLDLDMNQRLVLLNKVNTLLSSLVDIEEVVNTLCGILLSEEGFNFSQIYILDYHPVEHLFTGQYSIGYRTADDKLEAIIQAGLEHDQLNQYKTGMADSEEDSQTQLLFNELMDFSSFLIHTRLPKSKRSLYSNDLMKDIEIKHWPAESVYLKRVCDHGSYYFVDKNDPDFEADPIAQFCPAPPFLMIPLVVRKQVKKVLILNKYFSKQKAFNKVEISCLEWLVNRLRFILENCYRYSDLRQANTELRKMDQIKSNFLSLISHELRTPLINVIGFSHLLLDQKYGDINEDQSHLLSKILKQSYSLNGLIKNLLLYTQMESGLFPVLHGEKFNLTNLMKDVVEEYGHRVYQKEVVFKVQIQESSEIICFEPETLRVLIRILIDNAIVFSSDPVHIEVSAGSHEEGSFFIQVKDDGIGIPADEITNIFKLFYQVQNPLVREFPGLGLGLTILKEVLKKIKGKVLIKSEESQGSVFKILIPFMKES